MFLVVLVSFTIDRGRRKLEPCLVLSTLIQIYFKISNKHPYLFHMGVPS